MALCTPKCLTVDIRNILHSLVGFTGDVTGDHPQAARKDARHHRNQINLEPLLIVFWLKVVKLRSKGCQGQVQNGVSHIWILDEGDISLKREGDHNMVREEVLKSLWKCGDEGELI